MTAPDTTSDASLDARTTSAVRKLTQEIDESATMLVTACVPPEGVLPADRGMPVAGARQESRLQAGVLSSVSKDTMSALMRVVAKDTVSATVKPTHEIEEFSVDAVGYGMIPSLRGQPTAPLYCALPGERWLQGLRAERRAKDTTSALLLVVATDTKPAMVKLTQEIEESCVDAVVCGMMPSSWKSAMIKLTQEVEESRVDVVVTAWCPSSPMQAELVLQG